jgi:hypothetical protein
LTALRAGRQTTIVLARLILLSVVVVLALSALGLWATSTRSGEEWVVNWYLPGVAVVMVVSIVAGVVSTIAGRRRP